MQNGFVKVAAAVPAVIVAVQADFAAVFYGADRENAAMDIVEFLQQNILQPVEVDTEGEGDEEMPCNLKPCQLVYRSTRI